MKDYSYRNRPALIINAAINVERSTLIDREPPRHTGDTATADSGSRARIGILLMVE